MHSPSANAQSIKYLRNCSRCLSNTISVYKNGAHLNWWPSVHNIHKSMYISMGIWDIRRNPILIKLCAYISTLCFASSMEVDLNLSLTHMFTFIYSLHHFYCLQEANHMWKSYRDIHYDMRCISCSSPFLWLHYKLSSISYLKQGKIILLFYMLPVWNQ